MLRPVFIVGGSRTGSEMLKTMLSASMDLDFVDELFLVSPRWLHRDLRRCIRREVGSLDRPDAVDELLELFRSGRPYGWVWQHAQERFDFAVLERSLRGGELDLRRILLALMEAHAARWNKRGIGAKFPAHYSFTPTLMQWFPNCRIIHTTRDPRAVYASQANKYLTAEDGVPRRLAKRTAQFVHINIQVQWTARLHRALVHHENYRLVRFEDIVTDPEHALRGLCRFLEVSFEDAMLSPHQYGSTFGLSGLTGVDSDVVSRWRSIIRPETARAIEILQARSGDLLGYDLKDSERRSLGRG